MELMNMILVFLGVLAALFTSGESFFFKKKLIIHHIHPEPHPHPIYYKPWVKKVPYIEEEIYHPPPHWHHPWW